MNGSLITQGLHRIEPGRRPSRIEGRRETDQYCNNRNENDIQPGEAERYEWDRIDLRLQPEDPVSVEIPDGNGPDEVSNQGSEQAYQQTLERLAYQHGGGGVLAPAQRLADFVAGRPSSTLPACSYHPGVSASALSDWLPHAIGRRLQAAFRAFDRRMKGFVTNDAVVVGVESRTSSPVRIPRDPQSLQHPRLKGLFPCGEGAGYAGGIVSCAVDGQRVAEAVVRCLDEYGA